MATPRIGNDDLIQLVQDEEPRFLSLLLKDEDCLMDATAIPVNYNKDGHFWEPKHRIFYEYIHKYYVKHGKILTRTAMDSVIKASPLSDIDESAMMMLFDKIYSQNVPVDDYSVLKNHIINRYVQYQGWNIFQNNTKRLVNATDNQEDIVKDIRDQFNLIDGIDADSYSLSMSFEEGMEKAIEHITERREHPENNPGILCGIKSIDNMYYGFDPGSYTVISGMVNGGKTTLMFNMGFNMAKAGYNVIYVSLEKQAVPVYTRLLSLHALIDYNRIKRGGKGEYGLNDYYYQKYQEASEDLLQRIKPSLDVVQMVQGTKLSNILVEIDKILNRKHIDVLIVDYLGVVGTETRTAGRPDLDVANINTRLQAYGRMNKIATITGLQIGTASTRDIKNKVKKVSDATDAASVTVGTEDLTLSQRVIADADNGISIVLNSDSPPTKAFIHSTKARDSESRVTAVLDFDGKLGRIADPELDPGQVKDVDDIIYNKEVSEEQILSDDDLFGSTPIVQEKIDTTGVVEQVDGILEDNIQNISDIDDLYEESPEEEISPEAIENVFLDETNDTPDEPEPDESESSEDDDFDDLFDS